MTLKINTNKINKFLKKHRTHQFILNSVLIFALFSSIYFLDNKYSLLPIFAQTTPKLVAVITSPPAGSTLNPAQNGVRFAWSTGTRISGYRISVLETNYSRDIPKGTTSITLPIAAFPRGNTVRVSLQTKWDDNTTGNTSVTYKLHLDTTPIPPAPQPTPTPPQPPPTSGNATSYVTKPSSGSNINIKNSIHFEWNTGRNAERYTLVLREEPSRRVIAQPSFPSSIRSITLDPRNFQSVSQNTKQISAGIRTRFKNGQESSGPVAVYNITQGGVGPPSNPNNNVRAEITSPQANASLQARNGVTFEWSPGTNAARYEISLRERQSRRLFYKTTIPANLGTKFKVSGSYFEPVIARGQTQFSVFINTQFKDGKENLGKEVTYNIVSSGGPGQPTPGPGQPGPKPTPPPTPPPGQPDPGQPTPSPTPPPGQPTPGPGQPPANPKGVLMVSPKPGSTLNPAEKINFEWSVAEGNYSVELTIKDKKNNSIILRGTRSKINSTLVAPANTLKEGTEITVALLTKFSESNIITNEYSYSITKAAPIPPPSTLKGVEMVSPLPPRALNSSALNRLDWNLVDGTYNVEITIKEKANETLKLRRDRSKNNRTINIPTGTLETGKDVTVALLTKFSNFDIFVNEYVYSVVDDSIYPTVELIEPVNGDEISRKISVKSVASDNNKIISHKIYFDKTGLEKYLWADCKEKLECILELDTEKLALKDDGKLNEFEIHVVATDIVGQESTDFAVVTVNNEEDLPPEEPPEEPGQPVPGPAPTPPTPGPGQPEEPDEDDEEDEDDKEDDEEDDGDDEEDEDEEPSPKPVTPRPVRPTPVRPSPTPTPTPGPTPDPVQPIEPIQDIDADKRRQSAYLVFPLSSKLTATTVYLRWDFVLGVSEYEVLIGDKPDSNEYGPKIDEKPQRFGVDTTRTQVENLPSDGRTIYISVKSIYEDGSFVINRREFTTYNKQVDGEEIIQEDPQQEVTPENITGQETRQGRGLFANTFWFIIRILTLGFVNR